MAHRDSCSRRCTLRVYLGRWTGHSLFRGIIFRGWQSVENTKAAKKALLNSSKPTPLNRAASFSFHCNVQQSFGEVIRIRIASWRALHSNCLGFPEAQVHNALISFVTTVVKNYTNQNALWKHVVALKLISVPLSEHKCLNFLTSISFKHISPEFWRDWINQTQFIEHLAKKASMKITVLHIRVKSIAFPA